MTSGCSNFLFTCSSIQETQRQTGQRTRMRISRLRSFAIYGTNQWTIRLIR